MFFFLFVCEFYTPFKKHGRLSVSGRLIKDESGDTVELRGVALPAHNVAPELYRTEVIHELAQTWKVSVVRATVGVEGDNEDGFIDDIDLVFDRLDPVIETARDEGIYVVIDFNTTESDLSILFWSLIIRRYGSFLNLIFEIYVGSNPTNTSESPWTTMRPNFINLIGKLRKKDSENHLIIAGVQNIENNNQTSNLQINQIFTNPLPSNVSSNVLYGLLLTEGFRTYYQSEYNTSIANNIPIWISQAAGANSTGQFQLTEWRQWDDFFYQSNISWVAVWFNNVGSNSMLLPNVSLEQVWSESDFTEWGKEVLRLLSQENADDFTEIPVYTASDDFSYSNGLSSSRLYSSSRRFSSSIRFSRSSYLSNSNSLSQSAELSESSNYSFSRVFSTSRLFSSSRRYSSSVRFSATSNLSLSEPLSLSNEYSSSRVFSLTRTLTATARLTISQLFSESYSVTETVPATPTESPTPSSSPTPTPTLSFNLSSGFSASSNFSVSELLINETSIFSPEISIPLSSSSSDGGGGSDNSGQGDDSGLNAWKIVAIVLGCILFVVIILFIVYFIYSRKPKGPETSGTLNSTLI